MEPESSSRVVPANVVVLAPTERASYATDPGIAAEMRALVQGLSTERVEASLEGLSAADEARVLASSRKEGVPGVEALRSAAAAEARVLRRGKAAAEARSEMATVPIDRTPPKAADKPAEKAAPAPPMRRRWSTTANHRAGAKKLGGFGVLVVLLGIAVLAFVGWVTKGPSRVETPTQPSASVPTPPVMSVPVVVASGPAVVVNPPSSQQVTPPQPTALPSAVSSSHGGPIHTAPSAPTTKKPSAPAPSATTYDPTQGT